jgi:hypothetical protein
LQLQAEFLFPKASQGTYHRRNAKTISFGLVKYIGLLFVFFCVPVLHVLAQRNREYLEKNAVAVTDPFELSTDVYDHYAPYRLIMIGEMHGTNESVDLLRGFADLFVSKGDSIMVGFEIPESTMALFREKESGLGALQSAFFANPDFPDGRQSMAWAHTIAHLAGKRNVKLFFFDTEPGSPVQYDRDSMMYVHIKQAMISHPGYRFLTISGNAHVMWSRGERKTASFLRYDAELNLGDRFCSIGPYYQRGSCNANFGHGLEERSIGRQQPNAFDSVLSYDRYLIRLSPQTTFPYTALYYSREVTPSKLEKDQMKLPAETNR